MSGTIAKATILAELKRLKFDDEKTYTAHELKGVGDFHRPLIDVLETNPDGLWGELVEGGFTTK